jgi:hypothetical protein
MAEDMDTVKLRLSSLESQVAGLLSQYGSLRGDNAIIHQRLDRIETRLKRRLDLHEPV